MNTRSQANRMLAQHAAERGDTPAIVSATGVLTYRELHQRVGRYARVLTAAGLRSGDLLAMTLPDGPDAVAALLAALYTGIPFVWLDEDQPAARRHAVLADCAPRGFLAPATPTPSMAPTDPAAALIHVEGDRATLTRSAAPGRPQTAVPPDTDCLVYTSGSSGTPKGIIQRAGNLDQFVSWFGRFVSLGPDTRVLQWGRLTFDAAYLEILAAVHAGATLVVPPGPVKADPALIGEWLVTHRVTHIQTVPSLCRYLVNACADLSPVSTVLAVSLFGEPLHADLVQATRRYLPRAVMYNFYGPTECILATVCRVPDDVGGFVPLGEPIPGRTVLLTDDDGNPVPDGEVGEIRITSDYLAHGYLNLPAETRRVFLPGAGTGSPTYRSGDFARRAADSSLSFVGRLDNQVKIRGARVELGDIEAALYQDPAVNLAAVRLHGDTAETVRPVAYVEPRPDATVHVASLHRRLTGALPTYMIPGSYVVLDRMPLTSTGKIDRRRLPDPQSVPDDADHPPTSTPLSSTERRLGAIWCDVTGCAPVNSDDDFFIVGGYSLLAPQVTARVDEQFEVALPVRAIFEHPTLRELAARIDREHAAAPPPCREEPSCR